MWKIRWSRYHLIIDIWIPIPGKMIFILKWDHGFSFRKINPSCVVHSIFHPSLVNTCPADIITPSFAKSLTGPAGGHFNNGYELLNLRALKFSTANEIHIFRCMGKTFCLEFQRVPLKFHTKYHTHTLKDTIFIQCVFETPAWELLWCQLCHHRWQFLIYWLTEITNCVRSLK